MYPYRKLDVWQLSYKLAIAVYQLTKKFPSDERYGLTAQLRRAAVSIPTNIAEGSKRASTKDYAHFVNISEGSAAEMGCLLELSADLDCAGMDEVASIVEQYDVVTGKLFNFRRTLERDARRERPAASRQPPAKANR